MTMPLASIATFFLLWIVVPVFLALVRFFGLYTIVQERTCRVYVMFGKVVGVLNEPGLHFLLFEIGPAALVINFFGRCYVLDLRLDQEYPRSEPGNSEEGAPMGIGIRRGMWVSDPLANLLKHTEPPGSLQT